VLENKIKFNGGKIFMSETTNDESSKLVDADENLKVVYDWLLKRHGGITRAINSEISSLMLDEMRLSQANIDVSPENFRDYVMPIDIHIRMDIEKLHSSLEALKQVEKDLEIVRKQMQEAKEKKDKDAPKQ